MQRRKLLKSSLVGTATISSKAMWTTPVISIVAIPAHAMTTADTLYSGMASSPSPFTNLQDWLAIVTLRQNGAVPVLLQNLAENVRIAGEIDRVGFISPIRASSSCGELSSDATGHVSAVSDSSISLQIDLFINNKQERISLTVPSARSAVSVPPLLSTCTLG